MYEIESVAAAPVWRGEADYYRRRIFGELSYERMLDITCYDYLDALSRHPLLPIRQFATYLSSIWNVSTDDALSDMGRVISDWVENGLAVLPDEVQALVEQGEIDVPFVVAPTQALCA